MKIITDNAQAYKATSNIVKGHYPCTSWSLHYFCDAHSKSCSQEYICDKKY